MVKKEKQQPKTLGQRVRFLRGDLTQSEFADILRIKQAMISRYEADKETPSPKVLLRIATFSGKSIEWLLTGQDTLSVSEVEENFKRSGAKTTRNMTREDMIDLAGAYVKDTRLPESEEFADMMKDLFADRKKLRKVMDYYRYLRFEENAGSGK